MWLLKNIYNGDCFYLLSHKSRYTIGRQDADLQIKADKCISRTHAVIHFHVNTENSDNCDSIGSIELEDLGSTYGTYRNRGISEGKRLTKGQHVKLKANDVIRFGLLNSVWRVVTIDLVTTTSCLTHSEYDKVEECIKYLDGNILSNWCSTVKYLTMCEANITMKLLHALVEQKEVVTLDFWLYFVKAVKQNKHNELPKAEMYRPVFGADIDLSCRIERRTLFKNYTFVFLYAKHLEMYGAIVQAAGGNAIDVCTCKQKSYLMEDTVIVIQYTPSTQTESSESIHTISEYMKWSSKRLIPEYEIGLAVLHCSLEIYCNPNYHSMADSDVEFTCSSSIMQSVRVSESPVITNKCSMMMDMDCEKATDKTSIPNASTEITNFSINQESLLSMRVTETPTENCSEKRKRNDNVPATNTFSQSDEDIDIDIHAVRPAKKVCLNAETVASETVNSRVSAVSNFGNFLEKAKTPLVKLHRSEIDTIPTKNESNDSEKNPTNSRKRRIAILNENSDSDEDNLFNFDESNKTDTDSKCKLAKVSDDKLFGFPERQTKTTTAFQSCNSDRKNDVKMAKSNEKKITSMYVCIPKARELPTKVNTSGWLSCSLKSIKLEKVEQNNNTPPAIQIKREDDTDLWAETLKDTIVITKMSPSKIRSLNCFYQKTNTNINNNSSDNTSATNYKTFVKRYQVKHRNDSVIQLQIREI